jgi:hypothetical protein
MPCKDGFHAVLRIRIRDPVPFFDPREPGPGMGKNQDPGSVTTKPKAKTIFCVKILKVFDADPGWKNSDPV